MCKKSKTVLIHTTSILQNKTKTLPTSIELEFKVHETATQIMEYFSKKHRNKKQFYSTENKDKCYY